MYWEKGDACTAATVCTHRLIVKYSWGRPKPSDKQIGVSAPEWWDEMMVNLSDGRIVGGYWPIIDPVKLIKYILRVMINRKRQRWRWQASRQRQKILHKYLQLWTLDAELCTWLRHLNQASKPVIVGEVKSNVYLLKLLNPDIYLSTTPRKLKICKYYRLAPFSRWKVMRENRLKNSLNFCRVEFEFRLCYGWRKNPD